MQSSDFWSRSQSDRGSSTKSGKDFYKSAGELSKELNDLKEGVDFWSGIEVKLGDLLKLNDIELEKVDSEIKAFKKKFDAAYTKIFLSGKYDKGNALLYIFSGAGGVDAQDWASMLLQMYQKYCQQVWHGWTVLDHSLGEQGGTKSAIVEITGRYAYGYLHGESGVHRLVRISPFSAKNMRHTSFALVDVLPEIDDIKLEIDPKDIEMEAFRSSGPGGQNVNKVSTAVRVKHIPTGITVAVQSERSQAQNREKAVKILQSKLFKMMEDAKVKELSDLSLSNEPGSIEWGSQIRSYVLNPYKLVKDNRTGVESSQPEKVLDGQLDEFINAEIILK